jgi:ferritin|uniref:Ferritin-like diiron domain-containing protein n=1 Tax=viral metagenome TaxID=1070528 RepID=A0A6C0IZV9_9ZZZZ
MNNLSRINDSTLWNDEVEKLVNQHINIEMKNFVVYQALANLVDNEKFGLVGLSNKLRKEADEELKHARDFIDYQNRRGGKVDEITYENEDISHLLTSENLVLDVYKLILDLEKRTNLSLSNLHNTHEPALQDKIESYLHEQHDTQKEINDVIRLLEMGGPVFLAIHENELRKLC